MVIDYDYDYYIIIIIVVVIIIINIIYTLSYLLSAQSSPTKSQRLTTN